MTLEFALNETHATNVSLEWGCDQIIFDRSDGTPTSMHTKSNKRYEYTR